MANNKYTYQQVNNVSINKMMLIDIAANFGLNENDLRVILVLFTELNGWNAFERKDTIDPLNFKKIDIEAIGDRVSLKKKDAKKALKHLVKAGLVEEGSSDTVSKGYRFTF